MNQAFGYFYFPIFAVLDQFFFPNFWKSTLQPSELGLSFKEELLCEIRNMLAEFTGKGQTQF